MASPSPGSVFARGRYLGLRELLEQIAHLLRCHADAVICNCNRERDPVLAVFLSLRRVDSDEHDLILPGSAQ